MVPTGRMSPASSFQGFKPFSHSVLVSKSLASEVLRVGLELFFFRHFGTLLCECALGLGLRGFSIAYAANATAERGHCV